MSKILISYRREDSADVTGRIDDRLVQQFGRGAVFVDVDSIPFGVDFRKHLDEHVAKCDVFLVVIGPDWNGSKHNEGKSRLEDPRDFVRIEIESALKREIPVVPVLVRGAKIPAADRLPVSLHDLSYRNGLEVRSGRDFHGDMNRLIRFLEQSISGIEKQGIQKSGRAKNPFAQMPVGMARVPKGSFLYGDQNIPVVIDHDYWIDQYPVTNQKYGEFVLAGGYEHQQCWSTEGWQWKMKVNITAPDPTSWDDTKWNKPNQPIVGVSYHEAEAYAKWIGKRLPSEQEWEKAARGEGGRQYPWGEEFDLNKCNSKETGIGHTMPVSQYPNGVSPYGCHDMAGNVWEWCANRHDKQKNDSRVIRGGSWGSKLENLRAPKRDWDFTDVRDDSLGFRLVQDIDE